MIKNFHKLTFEEIDRLIENGLYYSSEQSIVKFEQKLCDKFNSPYSVALNSGTSAIHSALIAADIGPGDEVLVPALSLVMSIAPILYLNATPVFVDCQKDKIDFDIDDLLNKITPKTKAIIPVHLWGYSYNMSKLKEIADRFKLVIIEDACQALGSTWNTKQLGTIGDFGCFSMKDGKIISTGEGGFLLSNNYKAFKKCKTLRTHNFIPNEPNLSYQTCGYNYRLTEFQAILASKQLEIFENLLEQRKSFFSNIHESLSSVPSINFYKTYSEESPNFFSPLFFHHKGKLLSDMLSEKGVINSVGSFGLRPVYERKFLNKFVDKKLPNVTNFLNRSVAISLRITHTNRDLEIISKKIINSIKLIS